MGFVLDASALLAFLLEESGYEFVESALLGETVMASVNLGEVASRYAQMGIAETELRLMIADLPTEIIAVGTELCIQAALLLRPTRSAGLSLGDRVCLALARERGWPALTADRVWARVAEATGVAITLIR